MELNGFKRITSQILESQDIDDKNLVHWLLVGGY